jgi:hypothetical protein
VANRSVANHRSTLDDLGDHIDLVVDKKDANALAYCCGIATDRDKKSVAARSNRNGVREAENAIRT